MRTKLARGLIAAALMLAALPVAAQTAQRRQPGWIADARGCRIWNGTPKANQTITWSGPCQNNLAQGKGVLRWFENDHPADRYDGELVAGRFDGRGTYLSADGFRYEGEWRDGKANGDGVLTTKSSTFTGTWKDGCFKDGNRRAWVGVAASSCQ